MSPLTIVDPGPSASLVNGYQYTTLSRGEDIRRKADIQIRDVLNNTPNTCTFTVDGKGAAPQPGEEVQIIDTHDSNRLLFAGNVQMVDQQYDGIPGRPGGLNWRVTATDYTWLLNKYFPAGYFRRTSASDIVKALVSKYAPDFTSNHVQTNLAKLTITFDGSEDFATCLSRIATAIGGGHWYVDYTRDVHFFHTIPPGIISSFTNPQSTMRLGPGSPMTVSEGSRSQTTVLYPPGHYFFRCTFVYSNGLESALSPLSNCIGLSGANSIDLSNIPIGSDFGSITCVKRRIYYFSYQSQSLTLQATHGGPVASVYFDSGIPWKLHQGAEIPDNTTTSLTINRPKSLAHPFSTKRIPPVPVTPPAPAPPSTLTHRQGSTQCVTPQPPLPWPVDSFIGYAWGVYTFGVSFMYRDGSESYTSAMPPYAPYGKLPDSAYDCPSILLDNIPTGQPIGDVDVVARKIFAWYGGRSGGGSTLALPAAIHMWWIIPDNSTTSIDLMPSTFGPKPIQPSTDDINIEDDSILPVWPNDDGPSLENADPPEDVVDGSPLIMNDPQFIVSTDLSQVRNRILVRGAGTTLTHKALVGESQLLIADVSAMSAGGGIIITQAGQQIPYISVGVAGSDEDTAPAESNGVLYLADTLTSNLPQGSSIANFMVVEDIEAQKALGRVELDSSGDPTDGVHEYSVSDSSLLTPFQLYMRGFAELELFGRPTVAIKYATRDPKSRSGAIVHVNLNHPPCSGDFLIQDVTIDQIHDESDVLMPRYNVTASSVKFNLNDLLLQLLSGNVPSPGGAGNTNAAGIAESTGVIIGGDEVVPQPTRPRWTAFSELSYQFFGVATSPAYASYNWAAAVGISASGTNVGVTDSAGYWQRLTTDVGSNQTVAVTNAATGLFAWTQHNPLIRWIVRTSSGGYAHSRLFFALASDDIWSAISSDIKAGVRAIGLRYDTELGDTGLRIWYTVGGSSGVTAGSVVAPVAKSTQYKIEINVVGSICTVKVNGAAATLTVPTALAGVGLHGAMLLVSAEAAGAKSIDFKAVYGERD